jgi:hypothetical protein
LLNTSKISKSWLEMNFELRKWMAKNGKALLQNHQSMSRNDFTLDTYMFTYELSNPPHRMLLRTVNSQYTPTTPATHILLRVV